MFKSRGKIVVYILASDSDRFPPYTIICVEGLNYYSLAYDTVYQLLTCNSDPLIKHCILVVVIGDVLE